MVNKVLLDSRTPNLNQWLFVRLQKSNLWENLWYKTSFEDMKHKNSSFSISLIDTLFETSTFNDMLLSAYEQKKLNSLELKTIEQIDLQVDLDTSTNLQYQINKGTFLSDLNFLLYMVFCRLETHYPLLFNHVARSTFDASKDYISSILSCCLKSGETSVLEQRSILSGILRSLRFSPSYINHVAYMDRGKVKRLSNEEGSFTVNWFVPLE